MDWMVNNNWVAWILVCKLRTYNPTVKFLKYEFNNTLLGDVTLFRITPGKTWIQPYIYIYIYVCVCGERNLVQTYSGVLIDYFLKSI